MPEIKNNFTSGKMNKDLDERLVPSGEYIDAMNVQVSTSEGSDVGAVENILGNELVSFDPLVDAGSICVGSITDEANNALYYLIAGPDSGKPVFEQDDYGYLSSWSDLDAIINAPDNFIFRDKIFKIQNDEVTPVFVDNHTIKTSFDITYPSGLGTSQRYSINATDGIYAGMTCYFFNGPAHDLLIQTGGIGENEFSGPSSVGYGPSQPQHFYGRRSVTRKVLEAEYDPITNKTIVLFDKNLAEEHQVNQGGLGEAAYVNADEADYNYLIFVKKKILNFKCNKVITGLSILDDFLLFTDNDAEPKKLNITRSIAGTHHAGEKATRLVVPDRSIAYEDNVIAKEEHVTVIKKYPTKKLIVEQELEAPIEAVSDYNFTKNDGTGVFVLAEVGEEIIENFTNFANGTEWTVGDELRFLRQGAPQGSLPDDFDVRCKVKQDLSNTPLGPGIIDPTTGLPITFPSSTYKLEILSISPLTPVDLSIGPNQVNFVYVNIFDVVRVLDVDSLFEKKFVRFGYRWKYQDGEYSTFSPFTDTVFAPSFFEYNAVLGYNKAMENHLTSIKLREVVASNIPDDVVQVDLLYIESNATTVYIVDKIKYNDLPSVNIGTSSYNNWVANQFKIKSDLIYAAVPANQFIRPWDNVPRKALALEVTGNRLVFANYLQNYNMNNIDGEKYKPTLEASFDTRWKTGVVAGRPWYGKPVLFDAVYFDNFGIQNPELNFHRLVENPIEPLEASPSLKSLRSYQLGFTYSDEYGRETPVFTSDDATVRIPKKEAKELNLLTARITSDTPEWAKNFKMYIKETSNEYYNLPLDRVYKAEDGNLWLSFPSSERNKVDEQTYLILKKGADSNSLVEPQAKYKIIAIENEAPDFLKTKNRLLAEVVGGGGIAPPIQHLFNDSTSPTPAPFISPLTPSTKSFTINATNFADESSVALEEYGNVLSFDFRDASGRYSKRYPIVDISLNDSGDEYTIVTETPILSSETWMFEDNTTVPLSSTLKLRFYKSITRVKPEFDGKFFVKINGDSTAATFLNTNAGSPPSYAVVAAMNAYYFSDTGKFGITKGTIGRASGGNIDAEWNYYTSSGGTNPHTGNPGAIIHPGLGQGGYVDQTGIESTDGERDWQRALDFGTASDPFSNWFIDEIYYAGTHPSTSNSGGNAVDGPNVTNQFNYGKGIHEDGGQDYIEISFSLIGPGACQGDAILDIATAPKINFAKFNDDEIWEVGSAVNTTHVDQFTIVNQLIPGTKFRVVNDDNNTIYEITGNVTKERRYNFAQWALVQTAFNNWLATWSISNPGGDPARKNAYEQMWERFGEPINRRVAYKIPVDKNINGTNGTTIDVSGVNKTITAASADDATAQGNTSVTIQFIEQRADDDNEILLSSNPAVFETEPKENIDLNIFYEVSDAYPTKLDINTIERYIPIGANVTCSTHPLLMDFNEQTYVTGFEQNMFGQLMIKFNIPLRTTPVGATELVFTRADGGYTTVTGNWYVPRTNSSNPAYISAPIQNSVTGLPYIPDETAYEIFPAIGEIGLSWFNCYSYGNGVESNRVRDDFNQVFLNKGVKASTTLDTIYEEERRTNGLIYSGLYNSTSGVNSLNQFIQAEKITKDLNTTYGSIQKLFSRNTDLIAFCEDRVLRILANKDAVFNADGNPNLIATPNVLGQTMPFSGDFGIGTNPESFAYDSYRVYFTDAKKGAVLRLSKDGLTNLSDYGMSKYFRNNLKKYDKILGSYDDKKNHYNLTLDQYCSSDGGKLEPPVTISYKEAVRGWVSFKSFIPESATSMENNYYTFKYGLPYKHHINEKRNVFYSDFEPTSIEFYLNQGPDVVKSFKTLNYEGSQAKVYEESAGSIDSNPGQGYYNLNAKPGWSVQHIVTDLEKGKVQGNQFVEKEGKWFNYIQGDKQVLNTNSINSSSFNFQGIGRSAALPPLQLGCVDPNADNYNSTANFDDGSCVYVGCTDTLSYNGASTFVHPTNGITYTATIDDGSCDYQGCMTEFAPNTYFPNTVASTNYDPTATISGPCTYPNTYDCDTVIGGTMVNTTGTGQYLDQATASAACPLCPSGSTTGCVDPTAMNYDSTPGVCHDPTLCEYYTFGCYDDGSLDTTATNGAGYSLFVPLQTQLDSAANNGCNVGVLPYLHNSYSYTDPIITSSTYGTVISVSADNAVTLSGVTNAGMDCGCEYTGCMDGASSNYMPWATVSDASMCCVDGCTDDDYTEYDPLATCDDGSCLTLASNCSLSLLMRNLPNPPFNGAQPTTIDIPDAVFEEALEMAGNTDNNGNLQGGIFDSNETGWLFPNDPHVSDGIVCSKGFCEGTFTRVPLLNAFIIHSTDVNNLVMNQPGGNIMTKNYGSGVINDLSGLENISYNPEDFIKLGIHMQDLTNEFQHSVLPGVNILETIMNEANIVLVQLKSLPLSSSAFDLNNVTGTRPSFLEIIDCGMEEVKGVENHTFANLTITNNFVCVGSPFAGTASQEFDALNPGGTSNYLKGTSGGGWFGYGNTVGGLPAYLVNGNNMSYNGSVDSLGSAVNPLSIIINNSGNQHPVEKTVSFNMYGTSWQGVGSPPLNIPVSYYDYNRAINGTQNDYGITGASDVKRKTRTILRFINLPSLKHIYFDATLPSTSNFQNAYSFGTDRPDYRTKTAACFTTKGCHPDLKIHTGTFSGVTIFEQAFGTARKYTDETSNAYPSTGTQLNPNWTAEGEVFFLKYFEGTHRFVY